MPYLQITEAPSRAEYDQVSAMVFADGRPEGMLAHAAAELPDGRIQIVDVFATREQLEALGRDMVGPAFGAIGMPSIDESGGLPPMTEIFDWTGAA